MSAPQSMWQPVSLLDALAESVAVYEPDGTFVYVNPATERLFGRTRADLVGRRIWDLFPDAVGNPFHAAFERVRATGSPEVFDHGYRPWGRWFRNQIQLLDGRVHVVASDITEERRAAARLTALARASELFATPGDLATASRELGQVLAEHLGDACDVRVVEGPGPHGAWEPLLIPVVDEGARARFGAEEPFRAALAGAGVHSLLAVPIDDGAHRIGFIVMTRDRTPEPYTGDDLALLEELAARASLAVSRARLHEANARSLEAERAAREALAATNGTLNAMISAAPAAVMLLDADGTVRLWNRAAEEIFGWSAGEVLGRFLPAISDEKRAEFQANLARIAAGLPVSGVETKRRTRDRGLIDVELWAAPVALADGRVQCLSIVVDITERKREAARRDLLARASAVLASSLDVGDILQRLAALPVPVVADWCCVDLVAEDGWIDRVAVAHADPAKADVAARMKRRLAPLPEVRDGISQAVAQARGQLVREVTDDLLRRVARDDDHLACLRATEIRSFACAPLVVGGRSIGVVTFGSTGRAYDEADQALVEELGRRAAAYLENARLYGRTRALVERLESTQGVTSELSRARTPEDVAAVTVRHGAAAVAAEAAIVWITEPDGSLRLLDSAGVPEVAQGAWRRIPAGAPMPAFRVLETGEPLWVETEEDYARTAPEVFERQRAAGRLRAFAALPLTIDGPRGGLLVFSFVLGHRFSDDEKRFLTTLARQCEQAIERARLFVLEAEARQRAEAEQARAEAASRAKDEFLAMLGHELRNPLAPIVTALQLMKLRGDQRTSREQEVIERQVAHLERLVDDLLDVSRITRGKVALKKEPIAVADAVAKAAEMASPLYEQRSHRLSVAVPRSLRVEADGVRLAQVIANLLTNAAKYTEPGGSIAVAAARDGDELVLSVKDDGTGIEPELLPHVFDLFVQGARSSDRRQGGLGIGLTLVRNLVQLHGGSVEAKSDGVGKGSEFIVRLPALPSEVVVEELPSFAGSRAQSSRTRRVLLVDDNVDAAELMAEFLRAAGHEVALAHDGAQALRVAESFTPDVAILDIGLPVMDGYELAARLRGLVPARLAALTGYGQDHDRLRSVQAGFHAHFVKPIEPEELLRYVDE